MTNFRDIALPDTWFESSDAGVSIPVGLPTYRSVPLSCFSIMDARIDGQPLDLSEATITVDGATYRLDELPGRHELQWNVGDVGHLQVNTRGLTYEGLHTVSVVVGMRMPPYIFWEAPSDICPSTRVMSAKRVGRLGDLKQLSVPSSSKIKLGTSLYSYAPEQQSGMSLSEILRQVKVRGLGPGLEIIGHQSLRNFPFISTKTAEAFKETVAEYGLQLVTVDGNADLGMRSDRPLNHDEAVNFLTAQIDAARALGAPILKLQYTVDPEILLALVPAAERAGVRIGIEVHSPQSATDPLIRGMYEVFAAKGEGWLGFVPDTGASVSSIPESFIEAYRRKGIPETIIDLVSEAWVTARDDRKDANAERDALQRTILSRPDGSEEAATFAHRSFHWFGYQSPAAWADLSPFIFHVHGKVFAGDSGGRGDVSIPHREIFEVLRATGYEGYFCSEYEGWQWMEAEVWPPNSLAVTAEQHRVWTSILNDLA
jgi:sugar phosphate isomerase/epimerase